MTLAIKTLYLLPHSHTDIGYSHDPVVALELHLRFLDRAIALCERTRDYPEGTRFRWTVEVFSSVLGWWEQRDATDHARLRECLSRGEIDIGARYLNGTELYAPEDVAWEAAELGRMVELTGYRPTTAIQNDVNGFPLAFARNLAVAGVNTLVMGLNTTMGHSPFPRCSAFHWALGDGRALRVWNGWIYNRIKNYCHLDELGEKFHAAASDFLAGLPKDYAYDFAVTSATIGDNVGPFPALPDQVRRFNHTTSGIQLRLATFAEFASVLQDRVGEVPVHAGQWPDFWTFGSGSMPQGVAMVRRAQRRLRLVERFRELDWANESGGTLNIDRARRALAYACEHTCDSHTCAGEQCGSSDSLRQKTQIQVDAAVAESASMVLLRDHLAAMAADKPREPISVLVVNPHERELAIDYLTERKGMLAFATSRQPEHLFQFDREPTVEALAKSASFGARQITAPAESVTCTPLVELAAANVCAIAADASAITLQAGGAELRLAQRMIDQSDQSDQSDLLCPVSWRPASGGEMLGTHDAYPPFALVEEWPTAPFQTRAMEDMDPADTGWNPDLTFVREVVAANLATVERRTAGGGQELRIAYDHPLLRGMTYRLDEGIPDTLDVAATFRFDADPRQRAYYLALPLSLPGEDHCEYWADACGIPFRAGTDQLPGTCNSFYQTYRGVAVSRGGKTLYIASPDNTLFQFGGFTFGQLPRVQLQRKRPFVAAWLYNNYWGTNFPSYSPGQVRLRFRLHWRAEPYRETTARALDATFDGDYLTHPLA